MTLQIYIMTIDLISLLVKFSHELADIMTIYFILSKKELI